MIARLVAIKAAGKGSICRDNPEFFNFTFYREIRMDVQVLEIKFPFNGEEQAIYPVILRGGKHTVLVDCGYAGFLPLIEDAAREKGISTGELTGIIITHHDIDHMGGLFEMKSAYPLVKIYSSWLDEKYISGQEKSLRLAQAENRYPLLPEEQKPAALSFQQLLKTARHVQVDCTFSEDEEPPGFPGVKILNTPGHMPGHISIYVKNSKTLIAADAMVYQHGELEIANPHFTMDLPAAIKSVKKIQQLPINKIICYHGGVIEKECKEQLDKLVARYSHIDHN